VGLVLRNDKGDIRDYKAVTGPAGKERGAGNRITGMLCLLIGLRRSGIGDGLFYAALIICPAGNAGKDENVQGKQAKEPLHDCKDKGSIADKWMAEIKGI
jgi:hypothetical protein